MDPQQTNAIAAELQQLRAMIERKAFRRPGLRIIGCVAKVVAWLILLAVAGSIAEEVKKVHEQLVSIEQTIRVTR